MVGVAEADLGDVALGHEAQEVHIVVDDAAVGVTLLLHLPEGLKDGRVRLYVGGRVEGDVGKTHARVGEQHRLLKTEALKEPGGFGIYGSEPAGNCADAHGSLEK